jgi:hypothetical protein
MRGIWRDVDSADRHVVQIYNFDTATLAMTILAIPAYRLEPTGDTRLTFDEMPDGKAPALGTWFYPGDNSGFDSVVQYSSARRK